MNRLLQAIAAAMLTGCYTLPALAEEPPKFADHKVKVYAGKRDYEGRLRTRPA